MLALIYIYRTRAIKRPLDLLFCDLDSDLRKLVQFENRKKIWFAEPLFFSGLSIIIFFLLLTTFLKGQKIEALWTK